MSRTYIKKSFELFFGLLGSWTNIKTYWVFYANPICNTNTLHYAVTY